MKRKEKAAVDLGQLADDSQDALNYLYAQGYVEQVDAIRRFITEQGENFRRTMLMQRDIANDLSHKVVEAKKSTGYREEQG